MRLLSRVAAGALLVAPLIRADATIRYHTDIQTTSMIPAATLNQALGGMRDMLIRIKGNKAYSSQGNLTSILDLMTQNLVLMDAANKRFAAVPAGQYTEQLKSAVAVVPEQARSVLATMKSNLESRSTGRTTAIQGIQAEEREFVLTVDMPLPGGPTAPTPFMKMVMQIWTAKPEETQRVPALQELRNYTASASSALNPADMIKQLLSVMPGMGDSLGAMIEMTKNGGMMLRTHTELSAPILAMIAQQAPGRGLPVGLDPNAPLMQMNQEVVELSADALEDALFQIPPDYQPASLDEILKGAISAAAPPQFKQ
jgi:hypothetical protein